MQILCKFYANFIAISLFCGLLAINVPAWGQIYSHKMRNRCDGASWPVFDLPPLLPVEQRIDSSSFVFEGRVVKVKLIDHNERSYACATVAVYKVYKGNFIADTIEVLSYYGWNRADKRHQYIGSFNDGHDWMFFVNQNNVFDTQNPNGRLRFRLAFLEGGAIFWDEVAIAFGVCHDDCLNERTLENARDAIKKITKKCIDVEAMRKKKSKVSSKSAINISSFSPTSIAAGHLENPTEFVINGSGFGDTKGKVYFRNANVPAISMIPFDVEYVEINPQFIASWTNTEIILSAIPSKGYAKPGIPIDEVGLTATVGSGKIAVERSDSPIYQKSSTQLTVTHAIRNHVVLPTPWDPNPELQTYYELRNYDSLADSPNNYDFEFAYNPEFYSNKPAYNAFHRALDTWRKATGVRFTEACGEVACQDATANQVAVYF